MTGVTVTMYKHTEKKNRQVREQLCNIKTKNTLKKVIKKRNRKCMRMKLDDICQTLFIS